MRFYSKTWLIAALCWAIAFPVFSQSVPDDCSTALPLVVHGNLTCYYPLTGSTKGSTPSAVPAACGGQNDVWYRFKALQSTHRLSLSQVRDTEEGVSDTLDVQLFGGPCGSLTSLHCWTDVADGWNSGILLTYLKAGETYYLRFTNKADRPVRFSACLLTPPPPPAHDECDRAIELAVSADDGCTSVSGHTQYASATLSLPGPPCCEAGDVWYQFTATHYAHAVGLVAEWWRYSNPYDSEVVAEVYAGDPCTQPVLLASVEAFYYFSNVARLTNLTPGTTYYVRVFPKNYHTAWFNLCVTTPDRPVNDDCTEALIMPVNEVGQCYQGFSFEPMGAAPSPLPDCKGQAVNDVWYTFNATAERYYFRTYTGYFEGGPLHLEFLSGECGQLSSIGCRSVAVGEQAFVQGGFVPGSTYYVRAWSSGASLQILSGCAFALPAAPPNDACTDALPLSVNKTLPSTDFLEGTTVGVTTSALDCTGVAVQDVWYRFEAEAVSNLLQFRLGNVFYTYPESLGFELLSGDCSAPVVVFCQREMGAKTDWVLPDLTIGHTYWLRVFSPAWAAHDFSICLTALSAPPNDDCAQATVATVNPDLTCTAAHAGTLAGAHAEGNATEADVWYQFTALESTHLLQLTSVTTLYGLPDSLRFELYAGLPCAGGTLLRQMDPYTQMRVDDLTPGALYAVRVFSTHVDAVYSFEFCVRTLPPPQGHYNCAVALPLPLNADLDCTQVLGGNTAGLAGHPGSGLDCWWSHAALEVHELWYRFTALTSVHRVEVSHVQAVTGFGSGNFLWGVFQSDDCQGFQTLICGNGEAVYNLTNLTPGRTYYIVVTSTDAEVAHTFDLCVSTYPSPANDLCANALLLEVSAEATCQNMVSGTTLSAGASASGIDCAPDRNDVWYTFTATSPAHSVYLTNPFSNLIDYASYQAFTLSVYGGSDCDHLALLACAPSTMYVAFMGLGDLTPGAQYWVRVAAEGVGIHFDLCVGTLPQGPANDACAQAVNLPVGTGEECAGTVPGTTEGANPSVPLTEYYYYGSYLPHDVWYQFTATQANHVVVLKDYNYTWPLYLWAKVYSGTCTQRTLHPHQNISASGDYRLELYGLTPGATYYVQVYSSAPGIEYAFQACVLSPAPPANDACAGAVEVPVNADYSCQSVTYANLRWTTASAPGCAGQPVQDGWFWFAATSAACRVEVNMNGGQNFSMDIWEGTCDQLTPMATCADYQQGALMILRGLIVGHTYFLRLQEAPGANGSYSICIRSLPDAPPNDECAQALPIELGQAGVCGPTLSGTTLAATSNEPGCYNEPSADVWYQFTPSGTICVAELVVTGYPLSNVQGQIGMALYEGTCGQLTLRKCIPYLPISTQYFNALVPGNTYYLRVFSNWSEAQDFTLCLSEVPGNTTCDQALPVLASTNEVCNQPVHGSTRGLTEEVFSNCYWEYLGWWWPYYRYPTALWYRFTATSAVHLVRLENVVWHSGREFIALEISDYCNPGSNHVCSGADGEALLTNLVPGQEYSIRVSSWAESDFDFDLCVLTPHQPVHDNCTEAIPLPVATTNACNNSVWGTTLGATGSHTPFNCADGPDVFYQFTATSTSHLIHLTTQIGSNPVGFIEVLEGKCNQWTGLKYCHQFYPGSPSELLVEDLQPGETYYLRIGNTWPGYFAFEVCISTPKPDVNVFGLTVYHNGCQAGQNETARVYFSNIGRGYLPAGAVALTLTLSGANTGTYGPIYNIDPVPSQTIGTNYFSDIDLSNPGETQMTVTAVVPDDEVPANNNETITFSSLPTFTLYADADYDGYGNPDYPIVTCWHLSGYADNSTDCNDNLASINPSSTEVCNGLDDDCDGLVDAADPDLTDAPLPEVTCPADRTTTQDPGACTAVLYYEVIATDACGYTLSQTSGLISGAEFPLGTTVNQFQVTGMAGVTATCTFSVTVQKNTDPASLSAYTIIGLQDVYLQNNQVNSGGVGIVNAGKKVRLQAGTSITAANTFVKAPVLELNGNSQVATTLNGQVSAALLPTFKANSVPTNNNVTIPANSTPVTLPLESYGVITVGFNSTVIFSGKNSVRIKELTLKEGAKVVFAQNTELLIGGILAIGRRAEFNAGGPQAVQCFVSKNVTVNTGAQVWANLYTQQDLRLEKALAALPISMTGQFIALNVYALDFARWQWDDKHCLQNAPANTTERSTPGAASGASPKLSGLKVFPNPTALDTELEFTLEAAEQVTVDIVNALGQVVQQEHLSGSAGLNRHLLSLAQLSGGTYTVYVRASGQRLVSSLVVLRP